MILQYFAALILAWGQTSNQPPQPINFAPPTFTATSVRIEMWVASVYTVSAENRGPNPSHVHFGDEDGEGRCGSSIRLWIDPGYQGLIANVPHNVPAHIAQLGSYDGKDDFMGPSGYSRTFDFLEQRVIDIDNQFVVDRLSTGTIYLDHPGYSWIRWHGTGTYSTRAKHGARIRVTFYE